MKKNDKVILSIVVVLIVAAAVVWNLPENGYSLVGQHIFGGAWTNPWDTADTAVATASAQEWLLSDAGEARFPEGAAGQALPIFDIDGELLLWVIPIRNSDGLYIGHIMAESGAFNHPMTTAGYGKPRLAFPGKGTAIDVHTYFIIEQNGTYTEEEIMEPYIVRKPEGGYYWMSEVIKNSVVVDTLFVRVDI